jgi:NTP pyrophosphatase (non-canonical NTP hydrolase)
MTLSDLQKNVDSWIRKNTGYWESFQILARMTEELGEIAAALQRLSGLRPRKTEVDLEGEIGDLLFTMAAFANAQGIDLEKAFSKVMAKYDARDAALWQQQREAK